MFCVPPPTNAKIPLATLQNPPPIVALQAEAALQLPLNAALQAAVAVFVTPQRTEEAVPESTTITPEPPPPPAQIVTTPVPQEGEM